LLCACLIKGIQYYVTNLGTSFFIQMLKTSHYKNIETCMTFIKDVLQIIRWIIHGKIGLF
jgi:hypothetical protein